MTKPTVDSLRNLRTIEQACARLGVSRWTLDRMCKSGKWKLERVRLGGRTRITASSLNALVDEILNGRKSE